jgi:hypothetical protein
MFSVRPTLSSLAGMGVFQVSPSPPKSIHKPHRPRSVYVYGAFRLE